LGTADNSGHTATLRSPKPPSVASHIRKTLSEMPSPPLKITGGINYVVRKT